MKKVFSLILTVLLLTGCGKAPVAEVNVPETTAAPTAPAEPDASVISAEAETAAYVSQFVKETRILLSDEGITVDGNQEAVTTTNDIVYYEDRDSYASGNPYGEGTDADKHTAEEASSHTVVNITKPGAYRITGKLSAGQLRIDLGKDAYYDPDAVVELILDNADITCTVAPAILFENVYECDGNWSTETAKAEVDTTAAGAHLILEGSNAVRGSYVAKIYKDAEGEKKLVKQDGAIYSYMSLNVWGPGALELTAENEGLDTELHLTIHGGDIRILSDNDGINTNEDGVSVTTINGGNLTIHAGLGEEGDGVDSNGYLVINGGRIYATANPKADAGLDSDLGSFIHGGTVIAMGSAMDWAESASGQVTMNLQFLRQQAAGSRLTVKDESGAEIFSFEDDSDHARSFRGLILSHSSFTVGATYSIYVDDAQMQYTGNSLDDFGGRGPRRDGKEFPDGEMPQMPENTDRPNGERTKGERTKGERPKGGKGQRPNGEKPENFDPSQFEGQRPEGSTTEGSTEFYMEDTVNAFSGVTQA